MINFYGISGILTGVSSSAIAAFVYFKGRGNKINKLWAIFASSVAMYGFGSYMVSTAKTQTDGFFWWQVTLIGVILIPPLFLHFVYAFLGIKRAVVLRFSYVLAFCFLMLNIFSKTLFIGNVQLLFANIKWGPPIYWVRPPGLFYAIFIIIGFFGVTTYSHIALINAYKKVGGYQRNQIKYFFLATAFGFVGGGACFFPCFGANLYPLSNFTVALYPIIMTYAILRFRLMDINLVLTRAGLFIVIYTVVLGIPFWIGFVGRPLLTEKLGVNWWLLPSSLIGLLATLGPYVYLNLQRRAENRLFKEQRRYQETLRKASKGMTLVKDLNKLTKLIVHILTKTMRIDYAGIFLYHEKSHEFKLKVVRGKRGAHCVIKSIGYAHPLIDLLRREKNPIIVEYMKNITELNDQWEKDELTEAITTAQDMDASVIIPSFVEDTILGFLVLGRKILGHAYTEDDLNVLGILANQAALAIENAQFYEKEKIDEVERIQSEKFATIGRLATSAKHEIDNPLAMISMSLQTMGMELSNEAGNYQKIRKRLNDVIQNLTGEAASLNKDILSGEIVDKVNAVIQHAGKAFDVFDVKASSDKMVDDKIAEYQTIVKSGIESLKKMSDDITNESEKQKIAHIVHYYEAVVKNVEKIHGIMALIKEQVEFSAKNAKRIEIQTKTMHELPNKLDKDISAIDVDKLVDSALGFARQQTYWENLGATPVEINVPENCPKIRGYFNRLEVVILNLVINAYQAMTDAGLKSSNDRLIRINANIDAVDPDFIELHFSNKGPLIPNGNIEKIFDRGYTTKASGSGLGLHISRVQVEINKGYMYARNIEGFGPEFIIRLPIWKEGQ